MKKILIFLVAALSFAACDNDNPTPGDTTPHLTLTSENSIWFEVDGGEGVITYTLENTIKGTKLTATPSVEWIEATVGDVIAYKVAANDTEEERRGTITVTYGQESFIVSIMQRAQLNVDVQFTAKSLDGSFYLDKVEGTDAYSYNLIISDKGMNQSGNLYDDASYYLFDLYSALPARNGIATIPKGEYFLDYEKKAGAINAGYSYLVRKTSAGTIKEHFMELRVVVSDNKIEAFITLETGETHYLKYEGSLNIDYYQTDDNSGFSTLKRDYYFDINDGLFVGAYVGNMYYAGADTCQVYLFESLDLETGEEFGDEFQLDLQLKRGTTDICGTYTPGTTADHFLIGTMEDLGGGQYMQTNTWYMTAGYLDFAPLVDGTIIVEKDDNDVYTFSIDCVDDEGNKISGRFRGVGQFIEW